MLIKDILASNELEYFEMTYRLFHTKRAESTLIN